MGRRLPVRTMTVPSPLAALSDFQEHPASVVILIALLAGSTVAAAFGLRWISSRMRSLFHEVLAVTLASLALGAIGAVVLARLMILDQQQLGTVLEILATTAVLATVLIVIAAKRLGADVRRIELTLRRLEAGDRTQRTEVRRADELGHVARALDELTERLDHLEREREDYERERTELLSSVSHDLRTPLAALQVSIEAIADGMAPDPDRYIRSMKRDIQAIGALVDDLFLLARIEHDELDIDRQSFDLAEIADESIEALEPVAAARGLRLELSNTDRVRERQPHRDRKGHPQPHRQRDTPRSRWVDDRRVGVGRRRTHGPSRRRGSGLPTRVRQPGVRRVHACGYEPEPHDRWSRSRTGHRAWARRGPRRPNLDRSVHRRRGRVRATRSLIGSRPRRLRRMFRDRSDPCDGPLRTVGQVLVCPTNPRSGATPCWQPIRSARPLGRYVD